jgi:hypothetical protein
LIGVAAFLVVRLAVSYTPHRLAWARR